MNSCECVVSYSTKYKKIIHMCLECKSIGGTLGNVNHNSNCIHINCIHCRNYNLLNYDDLLEKYNKKVINRFKKNLDQHIKEGNEIIHKNKLNKINSVIDKKTVRYIFHFYH